MKAMRVYHAIKCPYCHEVIDPDSYDPPESVETWRCDDCGYITDGGPYEVARCSHEPSEVVQERCGECSVWQEPQPLSERKQCPLCDNWVGPEERDFEEDVEVYRCGACEELTQDRDDAMQCCRQR